MTFYEARKEIIQKTCPANQATVQVSQIHPYPEVYESFFGRDQESPLQKAELIAPQTLTIKSDFWFIRN